MRPIIQITLFLFFFIRCSPNVSKNDSSFNATTDQSEIFFKNIRASDYEKKEIPKGGMDIYIHKELGEQTAIRTLLVHNWRQDQAFILLEINSMSPDVWVARYDTILFYLTNLTALEQTMAAIHIDYLGYCPECYVLPDSMPLYHSEAEWIVFHEIMGDFHRLITR